MLSVRYVSSITSPNTQTAQAMEEIIPYYGSDHVTSLWSPPVTDLTNPHSPSNTSQMWLHHLVLCWLVPEKYKDNNDKPNNSNNYY